MLFSGNPLTTKKLFEDVDYWQIIDNLFDTRVANLRFDSQNDDFHVFFAQKYAIHLHFFFFFAKFCAEFSLRIYYP